MYEGQAWEGGEGVINGKVKFPSKPRYNLMKTAWMPQITNTFSPYPQILSLENQGNDKNGTMAT